MIMPGRQGKYCALASTLYKMECNMVFSTLMLQYLVTVEWTNGDWAGWTFWRMANLIRHFGLCWLSQKHVESTAGLNDPAPRRILCTNPNNSKKSHRNPDSPSANNDIIKGKKGEIHFRPEYSPSGMEEQQEHYQRKVYREPKQPTHPHCENLILP
uniref:Uncharacterized protein n=1 Tax=Romanomermis culicivorax TaxID=13658 RepID=A0A915IHG3_ROMCU